MSYNYQKELPAVCSEAGQRDFLKARDFVHDTIKSAGCVQSGRVMEHVSGSSWFVLACIDRLVELGEIKEVTDPNKAWGQNRIFVSAKGSA